MKVTGFHTVITVGGGIMVCYERHCRVQQISQNEESSVKLLPFKQQAGIK